MPSAWSYSRLMMMDGMQDLTILNKVSIRNISPWQDDEKNSPARVKMVLLDGPMTPSATFNPCSKVSGIYISYHIISYHIISYHIHIISYHIISYHIISYHIISYHIIITNVTAKQYVILIKKYHRKNTIPTTISCVLSKGPGSGKKTVCFFGVFRKELFRGSKFPAKETVRKNPP